MTDRRPRAKVVASIVTAFACTIPALPLAAQEDEAPPAEIDNSWREDPYTENDPKLLERAGYIELDRIGWSEGYTSRRIEQALGQVKIHWIETPHFRLGCALKKWKVPGHDKVARKRLADEIKRLRAKLPNVDKKPKSYDPWLRAHLYAQRLEDLYAEFVALVDAEESGPKGPFLKCKSKFRVMLLDEDSGCVRFVETFNGPKGKSPMRWYDGTEDCYTFASAVGFASDTYTNDSRFYCHVAFHVTHNLVDAYRKGHGMHDTPIWWKEGFAHTIRRRIADDTNVFTNIGRRDEHTFATTDWEYRVLGLMKHGITKPFDQISAKCDFEELNLQDHMEIYSRVDFLRDVDDEKFGEFIAQLAIPTTPKRLLRLQAEALKDLYGFADGEAFDAAWKKWAKKAYRGMKKKQ